MPDVAITRLSETVRFTNVAGVTATAIEQDTATGNYVREVRVYGADDDGTKIEVAKYRLESPNRAALEIPTPASSI